MPLKRTKKSVLFHKGLSDGADRFLLEPPAIDYAENLQFHKDGSLQKRPGFGPNELSSVPSATGDPFFLHGIGGNLHVIAENGAHTWNGSTWSSTNAPGFIGTSQLTLETQNFRGLGSCAYEPYYALGTEVVGHTVAYEVREKSSISEDDHDNPKHVILQWYDAEGGFSGQLRYDNACSPKLVTAGVFTGFFYCSLTTGSIQLVRFLPDVGTAFAPVDTGIFPVRWAAMPTIAAADEGARLGQGVYGQARYDVSVADGEIYCVANTDNTGGVFLTALNNAGATIDTVPISTLLFSDVMAVECNGSDAHVLYQRWDRDNVFFPDWKIRAARLGVSVGGIVADDLQTLQSGSSANEMPTFTHGTIAIDPSDGSGFVAIHRSDNGAPSGSKYISTEPSINPPPDPNPDWQKDADYWRPWSVRSEHTGIFSYEVTWDPGGSVNPLSELANHRLVTNGVRYDGKWYAGVQQWIDHTPLHKEPGAVNGYVTVFPAVKPVTTALCVFGDGVPTRPVATLDAGMSAHTDYAESEIDPHLGSLRVDGDDLLISNRVKLRAEDNTLYMGAADSIWKRRSNVEVSSDSLCRVHRIGRGITGSNGPIASTEFGDGIALGTAIPLWFDGHSLGEFGPIDAPAIIRIEDEDLSSLNKAYSTLMMDAPMQGYDEMLDNNPAVPPSYYRKFQAIIGYVDARGNAHRSAPSATLYVYDLEENQNPAVQASLYSGREVRAYVTKPVTALTENVEYFCEIYVSDAADNDPVLVAQSPVDMTTSSSPCVVVFQLNRAAASDQSTTIPILRGSNPVYTSGGYLAADPWPSFAKSVATSTRFWAIDAVNKGRVLVSKLFEDFVSPEYNSTLSINLGEERDLTAIGKLDDKVIVFEPNDIHVIYGDGPDNRGQDKDFAVHYISTDVGCEDQESVIETPAGLIFYNKPRGFYLLDRNLQVQFIGDGIEDVARDIDVVSATLVPRWAEVRFLVDRGPLTPREEVLVPDQVGPLPSVHVQSNPGLDRPPLPTLNNGLPDDACLVFNYEKKQWSIYSNYTGRASTIYQNQYTQLLPDWSVWQEAVDEGRDPAGTNRTLLRTPWIRLSEQVQDFSRLWKVTFLGRYISSLQDFSDIPLDPLNTLEGGDVVVRAWFDYESNTRIPQERLYRFQDFGYNQFNDQQQRAERFQFEWTPQRGRCQAVKFEIEEVNSSGIADGLTYELGRGFEIVSAEFDVGLSPMRSLLPKGVK